MVAPKMRRSTENVMGFTNVDNQENCTNARFVASTTSRKLQTQPFPHEPASESTIRKGKLKPWKRQRNYWHGQVSRLDTLSMSPTKTHTTKNLILGEVILRRS